MEMAMTQDNAVLLVATTFGCFAVMIVLIFSIKQCCISKLCGSKGMNDYVQNDGDTPSSTIEALTSIDSVSKEIMMQIDQV